MIVAKLGTAVLYGGYIALAYLALEPYVRRHWPDALISWTRLVGGRLGDPLVGRDILLGGATGVLVGLIWQLRYIAPAWFGWPTPTPLSCRLSVLQGGAGAIAYLLSPSFLVPSMLGILSLVVLVIVFRRRWIALTVLVVFIISVGAFAEIEGFGSDPWSGLVTVVCLSALVILLLVLFVRSGLLAVTVAFFLLSRLRRFPVTLDSSAWYSGTSTLLLLALTALTAYACRTAIRGYSKTAAAGTESSAPDIPPGPLP
jgi:hypothetical protein